MAMVDAHDQVVVYSCEMHGNFSNKGGAVYVQGNLGGAFGNCTVVDNEATLWSGAAGHGGGFYVSFPGSSPVMHLYNSIVWDNFAYAPGPTVNPDSSLEGDSNGAGLPDDAQLVQVYASDLDWTPPVSLQPWPSPATAPPNMFADPQFESPTTNDYRLKATSPCLDAGHDPITQWLGIPYDVLDLNDNMNTSEFAPYDLVKFRLREVNATGGMGSGTDGGNILNGSICDLGCHERQ